MILKSQKIGVEAVQILAALHEEVFKGGEVWTESSFLELFSMMGVCAWIVTYSDVANDEEKDIPAGFMMVRGCCDEVEIITLGVVPSKRRLGIGRYLLNMLFDNVKENNASLLLEVNIHNDAAISLYLEMGFKEVGYRKAYYHDGSDALLLKKM